MQTWMEDMDEIDDSQANHQVPNVDPSSRQFNRLMKEVERQTHFSLLRPVLSGGASNSARGVAVRLPWVNTCSRICADCIIGSGGSVLFISIAGAEEVGVGACSTADSGNGNVMGSKDGAYRRHQRPSRHCK